MIIAIVFEYCVSVDLFIEYPLVVCPHNGYIIRLDNSPLLSALLERFIGGPSCERYRPNLVYAGKGRWFMSLVIIVKVCPRFRCITCMCYWSIR